MKKINGLFKLLMSGSMLFIIESSSAQNSSGTINPGTPNDPMVVNPGTPNDSLSVNPGKPNDDMAAMTDTGFINRNIIDNAMEIQMAKLAGTKATSAEVKKVARLMVTDHTAILNDLKKLAVKKGESAKDSHMNGETDMSAENFPEGAQFNAKWASAMLTMHEAKIDELEKFMAVTRDTGLKTAIGKALPKLRTHRDLLAKIPGAKVTEDPNAV